MKKILCFIFVLSILMTSIGCSSKNNSNSLPKDTSTGSTATISTGPDENGIMFPEGTPETTSITLHCPKDYNMSGQVVVALEKGYFEAAGLDVEIVWYQNGGDIPTAMLSGGADLAFGSWINPLQVAAYGVNTKILCNTGDPAGTLSLVAGKNSGITAVTDITGKTVTIANAAVVDRTFHNICDLYNIDYDSINIVNADPSDGVAALMNGDVDAIFTWQPYCATAILTAGGTEIINGQYDYSNGETTPVSGVYIAGCTFFGTEEFVTANPNTIARLLWALAKATCDLQDDSQIDELAELTAQTIGTEPDIAASAMRSMTYTMEINDDWVATLKSEVPYYVGIGSLPSEIDPVPLLDMIYLDSINPGWDQLSKD